MRAGKLFPDRGIVRNGQCETSREALQQIRGHLIETYASSEIDRAHLMRARMPSVVVMLAAYSEWIDCRGTVSDEE